jgi:predicted RNase H-like nuclease (RuvC/YqgF family)
MTLKLVKAQAENDILKSSTLSVTKALADAQAKVVSDERETSLLRSSIEELKTESCQLSQKIDSMRESLMKDAKTALEKQISAEMKAADLHTQLDRVRVANKPVSHNVASSELIGAIPEDVQNLENNDHSRDLSCIRTLEKSESLNSEHGTLMPKDERIVKKSVLSNPSTSNEQDYARILVTGVMSTAVKNSCR